MTEPPYMPEGSHLPSPPQTPQHAMLDYHLAVKIGTLDAKVGALEDSRDKLGARMGAVEVAVARVEAGQAHAAEMRNAQHAEVMAQMVEMREQTARLADLPQLLAVITERMESVSAREQRSDAAESDRRSRSIVLPELTPKLIFTIFLILASVGAVLLRPELHGLVTP